MPSNSHHRPISSKWAEVGVHVAKHGAFEDSFGGDVPGVFAKVVCVPVIAKRFFVRCDSSVAKRLVQSLGKRVTTLVGDWNSVAVNVKISQISEGTESIAASSKRSHQARPVEGVFPFPRPQIAVRKHSIFRVREMSCCHASQRDFAERHRAGERH